jgi:hypothetical protein
VARQRSAKPLSTTKNLFKKINFKKMAVTRLKRKDRKNKTVSRLKVQHKKMATDKSIKKPVARTEENNSAE